MRKAGMNAVQYDCFYPHFMPVGAFWYGSTSLQCAAGYTSNWPGVCTKNQARSTPPAPSSCSAGSAGVVRGNPVQLISGAKVQAEVDMPGTGRDLLTISRTYRSQRMNGNAQSSGSAWSFSFDRELTVGATAKVIQFSDADGSYFKFSRQPDGSYTSSSDRRLRIQADKSDWLLTNLRGDIERYQLFGFGRLAASTQLIGSGAGARRFSVTRAYGTQGSATGHLSAITYPSGNCLELRYGNDGACPLSCSFPPAGRQPPS